MYTQIDTMTAWKQNAFECIQTSVSIQFKACAPNLIKFYVNYMHPVTKTSVLPNTHGPPNGTDLHFYSPEPDQLTV